jgi:hypothetical protein
MFLVSTTTAFLSRCLPETAGMALGDFEMNDGKKTVTSSKNKSEILDERSDTERENNDDTVDSVHDEEDEEDIVILSLSSKVHTPEASSDVDDASSFEIL